jgi:hypothetical protein
LNACLSRLHLGKIAGSDRRGLWIVGTEGGSVSHATVRRGRLGHHTSWLQCGLRSIRVRNWNECGKSVSWEIS